METLAELSCLLCVRVCVCVGGGGDCHISHAQVLCCVNYLHCLNLNQMHM